MWASVFVWIFIHVCVCVNTCVCFCQAIVLLFMLLFLFLVSSFLLLFLFLFFPLPSFLVIGCCKFCCCCCCCMKQTTDRSWLHFSSLFHKPFFFVSVQWTANGWWMERIFNDKGGLLKRIQTWNTFTNLCITNLWWTMFCKRTKEKKKTNLHLPFPFDSNRIVVAAAVVATTTKKMLFLHLRWLCVQA